MHHFPDFDACLIPDLEHQDHRLALVSAAPLLARNTRRLDAVFRAPRTPHAAILKCGPFPRLFIRSFPECIVNNGTVRVIKASQPRDALLKLQESLMAYITLQPCVSQFLGSWS